VSAPSRPDPGTYFTVTHPAEQTADWKAFYEETDRLTAAARRTLRHELDIPYGDHHKQYLDVYGPTDRASSAPVFVFVHGGGFREGDRAHYGYVAAPLAAAGIVTVVPSYRLLPEVGYFDAVEDTRKAIEWVAHTIEEHGGLPRRLVVGGHSAGAVLAAFVAGDRTWLRERSLAHDLLGGLVSFSVAYDFTSDVLSNYVRERLGSDDQQRAASPLLNVREPVDRGIVAVGANEQKYIEPSRTYAKALESAGTATELVVLDGLGHDGTVLSLADPTSELSTRILGLFDR
jgi:acetyl esterase/lipase